MVRRPLIEHMSRQNHSMYYVNWKGPAGEVRKAQSFPLNWTWNCDGGRCGTVSPAIRDTTGFFHCLDCFGDGFDLVRLMSDNSVHELVNSRLYSVQDAPIMEDCFVTGEQALTDSSSCPRAEYPTSNQHSRPQKICHHRIVNGDVS
jgi:hypothetical protein